MPDKMWKVKSPDYLVCRGLQDELGVSPLLARLLANRGISNAEEALEFLRPEAILGDPRRLTGIETAAGRLRAAARRGERVLVYGDYDADGVTATVVLLEALARAGVAAEYYIPNRLEEGYGLNEAAVREIAARGIGLMVTVDCGISASREVAIARELGLEVIVTDHHEPPETLPEALALVNPKLEEHPSPLSHLSGVGVAFQLARALLGSEADNLADLVAVGTIADIVPLLGENRWLVKAGLRAINAGSRPGLTALAQVAMVKDEITADRVAYALAPRLNAAGRIGDAELAVRLLTTRDATEAAQLAAALERCNRERQGIEQRIFSEALVRLEAEPDLARGRVIVLAGEGWHHGVIGIVASKLSERFYRPTVLLCLEEGEARGSARSIAGFHLFDSLTACQDLLLRYGGHAMAAGLACRAEQVEALRERLEKLAADLPDELLAEEVEVEAMAETGELSLPLIDELNQLAPFGEGNPVPVLGTANLTVVEVRTVGLNGTHLKLKVRADGARLFDAVGFSMGHRASELKIGDRVDLVFSPERNIWNGRESFQMNLVDLKPAGSLPAVPEIPEIELPQASAASFVEELYAQARELLQSDIYRDLVSREAFYTKVAGVTFENRQAMVSQCRVGESLRLVRQPENPHDPNAVAILNRQGQQLGFLNARLAKNLAPLLDGGETYLASVSQVTGGGEKNWGLNIYLERPRSLGEEELTRLRSRVRLELAALDDARLLERIRQGLLGDRPYRPRQQESIEALLAGESTLLIMGTGRGKSVVFQTVAAWLALRHEAMTAIVYPLRALVNDQFDKMVARLSPLGLNVLKANGSLSASEREELNRALFEGRADILLTTPEFIECNRELFEGLRDRLRFFVVDESHHIALASASHRPAYRRIGQSWQRLGRPLTLAVTATAGDEVVDEIQRQLALERLIIDPHIRSNLQIVDYRSSTDREAVVEEIIRRGGKTLVYVNSRWQTVRLASEMRKRIPEVKDEILFYHAGMTDRQRKIVEKLFAEGTLRVVVSTSAFGEGIDIEDIRHVVHYHMTFNATEFNQQSGRAGRDGNEAWIYLLFGERDARLNRLLLDRTCPGREVLGDLYRALNALSRKGNPVVVENRELLNSLEEAGHSRLGEETVSAGLGILQDLGLIEREVEEGVRHIHVLPAPRTKLDLEMSARYREGQEEKAAFEEFQAYVLSAASEVLLAAINRPIYPASYHHEEEEEARGSQS
ncbi:MAG: single-stranded-DNA-specific exonuclease RecJ [Bacillota bacterium]